ncbi:MAG: SH3 domain-containing protein [Pseudomonadota bacterium]
MLSIVRAVHTRSYEDPIRLKVGDHVRLTGRVDQWQGYRWLWAIAPDGRAGWIPDDLIVAHGGQAVATEDYSALELSCRTGETVDVIRTRHGWAWCRNAVGEEGWVPLRNLDPP